MARIGVLGLEPYLVTQVEQLDRGGDVVVMDSLDDEDRDALQLEAVVVSRDHGALARLLSSHPDPPVVVIEDAVAGEEAPAVPAKGEPVHLQRPVSSPQLRDALDRSLGVLWWRRALRSITIEQDDRATPDRWLAVLRSLGILVALGWGVNNVELVGVLPLVGLVAWLVARALWWRLRSLLVGLDVLVVAAGLVAWGAVSAVPAAALAWLAAIVAIEAGFRWGWWRAFTGLVMLVVAIFAAWSWLVDRPPGDMLGGATILVVLMLPSIGAGAMAKRLWIDATRTRTSELRRFRSSLYELSRRQAVVAVSFDLGTVAQDALARLIGEVNPQAALVLVADGSGPLQVAASHNLGRPPPARLTWRPGVAEGDRQVTEAAERRVTEAAAPTGEDEPGAAHGEDEETGDILADFPDIDPGADLVPAADETTQPEDLHPGAPPAEDPDGIEAPPPAWETGDDQGPRRVGSLAQRLAMRQAERKAQTGEVEPAATPESAKPTPQARSTGHQWLDDSSSPSAWSEAGLAAPPASAQRTPGSSASDDEDTDTAGAQAPPTAREMARAKAGDPVAELLARTTVRGPHEKRLREVLGQLVESLPDGPVYVEACEVDGELMGALVAVAPDPVEPVQRHAEETALALDSVRLFNRLRAFTRDQERARIGRSLHDGVMQTLAHVAFELDRVSNDSWDDRQVETLGRLRDHVLGTVDEMRAVVNDLRTVRLDRGLPAALEAMALTLSPAGGPVIEVQADQVPPQPADVEEQFLRVAEEALNNAVQHSGARNVTVRLEGREGGLLLQVLDDGFGFSQAKVGDDDGGVGLTSMYQRARSIGAGLDIDTGANGTIITLHHQLIRTPVQSPHEPEPDPESVAPVDPPTRWWRRGS